LNQTICATILFDYYQMEFPTEQLGVSDYPSVWRKNKKGRKIVSELPLLFVGAIVYLNVFAWFEVIQTYIYEDGSVKKKFTYALIATILSVFLILFFIALNKRINYNK